MSATQVQEIRAIERWGCSHQEYLTLRCKPMRVFQSQRANARCRGIEWNLTLWQWWTIWQESGHWDERGRGADCYCMCRFGDDGPYSLGNIYIGTCSQNISDGFVNRGGMRA